jgi:hypothetical protein
MSASVVPQTLDELKAALGLALLDLSFAELQMEVPSEDVLGSLPRAYFTEAADVWRSTLGNEAMSTLRIVAERALQEGPRGARLSIMSDLVLNVVGIKALLETVQPTYLGDIFRAVIGAEDEQLMHFLSVIRDFASGR